MNKLLIIGNLTRDPEMRTTQDGRSVCTFSVAVNRKPRRDGQQEADYFKVTAWRDLGENCGKYLAKGRKVAVTGSIRLGSFTTRDGKANAYLDLTADDVEFLSPRQEEPKHEMTEVNPEEIDLPF